MGAALYLGDQLVTPVISVEAPAKQYGITASDIIGTIDADGTLKPSTTPFTLDLAGVKTISQKALQNMFSNHYVSLGGLNVPDLEVIEDYGMQAFANWTTTVNIENLVFSKLTTIKQYGMSTAFAYTTVSHVSFPQLIEIGANGLYRAFYQCNLQSITFDSLVKIDADSLTLAFGFGKMTSIYFPALSTVDKNAFRSGTDGAFYDCYLLKEIHFNAGAQAAIEATTGYANKWGATNATIYFDL